MLTSMIANSNKRVPGLTYGTAPKRDTLHRYTKDCEKGTCFSCLKPCDNNVGNLTSCYTTYCMDDAICAESCDFLQTISTLNVDVTMPTVLDSPEVVCKNVSYGTNFCKHQDVAGMFLKWNPVSRDSNEGIVYVVHTRYQNELNQTLDKWDAKTLVPSVYAGVTDLRCSTNYQFKITAVNKNGVIGHSLSSNWSKTHGFDYKPSEPVSLSIKSQSVVNYKPSAIVVWNPGKDPSCSYQIVWLGHKIEQYEIKVNETGKFEFQKVNLTFSQDYKIRLSSSDYLFEHRSDELVTNLTTPGCLVSLNYNHSACVPLPPTNLTLEVTTEPLNTFVNATLSWQPPPHSKKGDILEYRVKFRKEPLLPNPARLIPHVDTKTTNSSKTSVEIRDIHNNNMYSFIVSARSLKGEGPSESLRILIDEPDTQTIETPISDGNLTALELLSVILIPLVLCIVLFGIICIVVYKRRRSYRRYTSQRRFGPVEELNPIYDGIALNINNEKAPLFETDSYEIEYSKLDFITVIGEGAFGKVVKAEYYATDEDRRANTGRIVAVKMLRDFYTGDESRNFLLEIQAMKNLGHHPCIVSIIGCCLTGPKLCLVMDYCALGDLRNYLRKYREKLMYNMPTTYGMMIKTPNCYMQDPMFTPSKQTSSNSSNSNSDGTIPVDVSEAQLISYARQVTMGMEFLEQRKFIHRDLATRNILLYDHRHAKISDFGLTRDVYETNVYQPTSGRKLPYKWMAIESLFTQRFTIKSDVWSFGIVLWEIVTLGGSPYPSIPLKDLYGLLNEGYRMEKPENCSAKLYQIMISCWHPNPNSRPSFSELRVELEKLLEETRSYIDLSVEVSEDYFNESTNGSNQQVEENTSSSRDNLKIDAVDENEVNEKLLSDVGDDVTENNSERGCNFVVAYVKGNSSNDEADYLESVNCKDCSNRVMSESRSNSENSSNEDEKLKPNSCDTFECGSAHSAIGKSHHLVKSSFLEGPAINSFNNNNVNKEQNEDLPISSSLVDLQETKEEESASL
ncbi:hypothetical protein ACF0H5_008855 [Mactra antiquata]